MIHPFRPARLKLLLMIFLLLFVLMMQGCFHSSSGGGNGGISNADPTGYYTNSGFVQVMMADDTTPRVTEADFQGMVTDSQFMMLSDTENLSYIGTFTVSGNELSGSVTLYEAGVMTQEDVPLTAMITATSKITGTLGGAGAANGTFQLNYAMDNSEVTLDQVVRAFDWREVVNPNIPSLDLANATDPAPAFNFSAGGSGSNIFSGCGYLGRMEPIVGTHLYSVSVTMDGCDPGTIDVEAVPTYTGLASVRDLTQDRFILALTNGTYDFSGEYFECLEVFCTPQ